MRYQTPDRWAEEPLQNIPALLSDHAYLERKAASNALELLNRWPEPHHPAEWTPVISTVARDEAAHLQAVVHIITEKKWKLERLHRSNYAGDLRKLVRMGRGPEEIVDRLLVSALIEARSCERFEILSRTCEEPGLAKFYGSLCASEWGHFNIFIKLAAQVLPKKTVNDRWDEMLDAEAKIIQDQPSGPGLHSGLK